MSTVTESALRALLRDPSNFHFDDYVEVVERGYYDGNLDEVRRTYGFATRTATCGDLRVVYQESFDYERNDEDSFDADTSGIDDGFRLEGGTVIDDDGNELDTFDLREMFLGASDDFTAIDYRIDFNEAEIVNGVASEDAFSLRRTGEANMVFDGKLIAEAATSSETMHCHYSGSPGRWMALELYRTDGGQYVCHRATRTLWQGDRNLYETEVVDDAAAAMAFFGDDRLARRLYDDLGDMEYDGHDKEAFAEFMTHRAEAA